jgi:hypothetical protein
MHQSYQKDVFDFFPKRIKNTATVLLAAIVSTQTKSLSKFVNTPSHRLNEEFPLNIGSQSIGSVTPVLASK